jgi:hypothetical protein
MGGMGGVALGVVGYEFEVENIGGSDAVVDDSTSGTVVHNVSPLQEKTNGRALAGMNDGDARFGHARGIDLPHAIKLGNVVISFCQHLLRTIEASAINDDGLGKKAIIRCCISSHGTVKKCFDVGSVLLAINVFKTAGKELAGVMRV